MIPLCKILHGCEFHRNVVNWKVSSGKIVQGSPKCPFPCWNSSQLSRSYFHSLSAGWRWFLLFKTVVIGMKFGSTLSVCVQYGINLFTSLENSCFCRVGIHCHDHCPCRQPCSCRQSLHVNREESVIWLHLTYQRWILKTSFIKRSQWHEIWEHL